MRKSMVTRLFAGGSFIFCALIAIIIFATGAVSGNAAIYELTDVAISDAVEDELARDPAVSLYRVYVSASEGIVTLRGSVDNMLAKERAGRIAGIVKGVRGVVNLIEVIIPPDMRADIQIEEDVRDALATDPATDAYEIDVRVKDMVVTLSGNVDSWQEKKLCETVAKGVRGVKALESDIRISWPEKRSDREIREEVEGALKWDAFLDHALIDVEVREGKVTLRGTVGSAAEKLWAFSDAHVYGVKYVDDSGLEVKRWARDPDLKGRKYEKKSAKEIEKAVKDTLLNDPRVFAFNVTPEVARDGTTVILRGTVDNLKAKRAAARDARHTVGVRRVDNRIKVRPVEAPGDGKIEDEISGALRRDPYVEKYEIVVDVRNGVVDLYGTVDSYFEKTQAEEVVSRVNGVIAVDNYLIVQRDYAPLIYDPHVDDRSVNDYDWYDYSPGFTRKSDLQIKRDILNELFWSPFVDADEVEVSVDDGMATLRGSVDSWSEYSAAANNAYEGGAVYVNNDLQVK